MKSFKYLYRELLRQQKISGIVFGICGALCVCAVMLIYAFAQPNMVPALLFNPYAYFMMIVGGTVFPLVGFSYLNKRNSADIFHSFPASRLQLFLATAAASASWIVVLNLLTYIASLIGYLLVGTPFSLVQMLCQFVSFTVGALCIMAGTMVGIGITGSTFSALLASLVINYVPRLTLTAIAVNAVQNEMLCFDELGILSPQLNFAYGSWLGLMFNSMFAGYNVSYDHMMNAWFPIGIPFLYTLLVTAALTALAAWLFIRRRSESAGYAATSPLAQHIVRCGVAAPFLIGLMMTFDNFGMEFDEPFFWVVVLGALCVYIVYELISVRSFKKMVKTLPLFVCMAVLLLIGGYVSIWGGNLAADRTVRVEEIKSVSFTGSNEMYPMDNEYSWAKYGRLSFDSQEIRQIAADTLEQNVGSYREYDSYPKGSTVRLRVEYNTKTGSFSRYLRFSYTDYLKLLSLTVSDPKVEEINASLPAAKDGVRISANCYNATGEYTQEEREILWDMAVEEYVSLSEEQKILYHSFNGNSAYGSTVSAESKDAQYTSSQGWVKLTGIEKGRVYTITLYLNAFFPKTLEQMYAYAQNTQDFEDAADLIGRADAYQNFEWSLNCHYPDGLNVQGMSYANVGLVEEEMTEELFESFQDSYVFLKEQESLIEKLDEVHGQWETNGFLNVIGGSHALDELRIILEQGKYTGPDISKPVYSLTVYTSDPNINNHYYNLNFSLE